MRGGLAAALVLAAVALTGESGEGTLRVEIREAGGGIVPAMVCVTSLADGKWRLPPDGRTAPPPTSTRDFFGPREWKPGEPGPVRATNGDYKNNDIRGTPYEGHSNVPYWEEPAAYFVSRPFEMTLPAGRYRLAVARGPEYLPHFEEIDVKPGAKLRRGVALKRWVDMARRGWYSGDVHVHYPRTRPEHSDFLLTWAQAEDVRVVNVLRMGDVKQTYFEQSAYGPEGRSVRGDYVLVPGQEDPRTGIGEQGHTIALNITAPVRDTSRYRLYDFMFDGVHRQGGLTGYAHKAWAWDFYRRDRRDSYPTWDSTINVVRGKVDFFEVMQFRRWGLDDFYDFLNLGFRLTAAAGSDMPWGASIGESRVYCHTGPRFSADEWFAALKRGRTFVTNGPMLEFTVDGALPGDEVKPGRPLRVRARAWAPPAIGSPRRLEVVGQGKVIRFAESGDAARRELGLEFTLPSSGAQWLAARVTSHNGASAHTSPVYVTSGGGDFRHREEMPQLVAKRLRVLDFIAGRLDDPKSVAGWSEAEVAGLRERIEEARRLYRQR